MLVTPSGNVTAETIAVTVSGNIATATIAGTALYSSPGRTTWHIFGTTRFLYFSYVK